MGKGHSIHFLRGLVADGSVAYDDKLLGMGYSLTARFQFWVGV